MGVRLGGQGGCVIEVLWDNSQKKIRGGGGGGGGGGGSVVEGVRWRRVGLVGGGQGGCERNFGGRG